MKPYEIYAVIEAFDKMWGDNRFTLEAKARMAQEYVNSLPPAALSSSSKTTHAAVKEYIVGTVNGALDEAGRNAEQTNKTTESQPTKEGSLDGQEQAPASNNKDEARGRGKVAKAPGTPKKRGSKKSQAKGNT